MKREYTAVDIFSGAGGLSIGASMAGIKPVMAVEYDIHAANTYKLNHPTIAHNVLHADIQTIEPLKYTQKHPFILFGGPPCQGFSIANTKSRNIDNPNNWMFQEYIRFLKDLEPEWFLFENVVGFKSFGKGEFAKEVEQELQNLGYETNSSVLNAADFGVPQKRSRFFIVGHKKSKGGIKFDFNKLEKQAHISVEEALHDLPHLTNGEKLEKSLYKSSPKSDFAKLMRNSKKRFFKILLQKANLILLKDTKLLVKVKTGKLLKKKVF